LLLFRLIRRFISFILLLLIAIPLYVVGSVWYTARNTEPVKSDFILVMGAAQFDGRPSDILKSRLEHALDIYKAGYAPKIYTVGAGAPGDRTTEAAASKAWLIDRGVKKNNVIAVAKGRDTLGSTKAYVEAADKAKLKSVIIVTDPYHCLRSKKMAQNLGLLASCTAVESGPASVANSEFKYLARESGAYLAYITLGRFGINLSDR
jgi:uncharacterized SAM-binding protein YcdF (DUF218 family)